MSKILVLTQREFKYYFYSPFVYVIIFLFTLMSGWIFSTLIFRTLNTESTLRGLLGVMEWLSSIMIPMITMRLLAEEKKSGTLELLVTLPVSDLAIILSKFLGAFVFYLLIIMPSLTFVFILDYYGNLDYGQVISGYLGLILTSSLLISIGLFISSMCVNQISAAIITYIIFLFFYVLEILSQIFRLSEKMAYILSFVSIREHANTFYDGVLDTRDLIYFMSGIVFFIFLSIKVLESRRWR